MLVVSQDQPLQRLLAGSLQEDTKHFTAFVTPFDFYEYNWLYHSAGTTLEPGFKRYQTFWDISVMSMSMTLSSILKQEKNTSTICLEFSKHSALPGWRSISKRVNSFIKWWCSSDDILTVKQKAPKRNRCKESQSWKSLTFYIHFVFFSGLLDIFGHF